MDLLINTCLIAALSSYEVATLFVAVSVPVLLFLWQNFELDKRRHEDLRRQKLDDLIGKMVNVSQLVRPKEPAGALTPENAHSAYSGRYSAVHEALHEFKAVRVLVELYFPQLADPVTDVYEPLLMLAERLGAMRFDECKGLPGEILGAQDKLLDFITANHQSLVRA